MHVWKRSALWSAVAPPPRVMVFYFKSKMTICLKGCREGNNSPKFGFNLSEVQCNFLKFLFGSLNWWCIWILNEEIEFWTKAMAATEEESYHWSLLETCRCLYSLLNVWLRHAGCLKHYVVMSVWFIIVALQQYNCMLSFNQTTNKLSRKLSG